jgi:hypothetical protein
MRLAFAPMLALSLLTLPSCVASADPMSRFSHADFDKHIAQLKKKAPAKGFTIVAQPPFVIVGDEPASTVRLHAENTVRWAVDRLKQDYFKNDPSDILDIWLFKDRDSYEKYSHEIFGDTPDTPYGYYSSSHKALIMNIGTGSGTLVHEIVHPFMEANFPNCPPWFNEGMGSLYEACGDKNGHIYGHTNWRLPLLQKAIRKGTVPSFKELTSMDYDAFYNQDKGTNYGQSRYLCYYLQEKGLLVKYYQEFFTHRRDDPTGFKSLKKILGETDMEAFKKRWEAYVLKLIYS